MSDTLTVWSREPFTDERRLPQNTRWSVEPTGFVYAAPQWRMVVAPSEPVDARSVPRELGPELAQAQFRTDVRVVPFDVPEPARELFEWTARIIALSSHGVVTAADPRSAGTAHRVVTFSRRSRPIDPSIALPSTELLMPRDSNWRARYNAWIALAIVLFLGALVGAFAFEIRSISKAPPRSSAEFGDPLAFDAVRWDGEGSRDVSLRLRMLDDLIEQQVLIGQSVNQVRGMLGPRFSGEATGSPQLDRKLARWDAAFRIGPITSNPNRLDRSVFVGVRLDANDLVTKARAIWP